MKPYTRQRWWRIRNVLSCLVGRDRLRARPPLPEDLGGPGGRSRLGQGEAHLSWAPTKSSGDDNRPAPR